jgi:hypothetical protein
MDINQAIYKTRGCNDECYSPAYAVESIVNLIPNDYTIWCPFDKEWSQFVQVFKKHGFKVIHSHIDDGKDFFTYEPEEKWDIIVSNPPFTKKKKYFERAFGFNKPFMLLNTAQWLNDAAPCKLYKKYNKEMEIVHFTDRIKYYTKDEQGNNVEIGNKIPFKSVYFCSDVLPRNNVII